MKMTDEQLLAELREAGHDESARVLEQKLVARAAVARVADNEAANDAIRAAAGARVSVGGDDGANQEMNAWLRASTGRGGPAASDDPDDK